MAVAATNITVGSDVDGGSTAATASITPAANNLMLLVVASRTGITVDPNQPTVTGNGLTWVAINSVVYDNTSASRRRLTVFRALGASPTAGTISIDFGGQAQTDITWIVDQLSGIDTSGTNGSGAIVQSVVNSDPSGTGTSLTVTLAAFSSSNNATYGAFANVDDAATRTPGTGFTLIGNAPATTNAVRSLSEFRSDNDTTVDFSWSGAGSELGGIGIEIKAAAVAGGGNDWPTVQSQGFRNWRY